MRILSGLGDELGCRIVAAHLIKTDHRVPASGDEMHRRFDYAHKVVDRWDTDPTRARIYCKTKPTGLRDDARTCHFGFGSGKAA